MDKFEKILDIIDHQEKYSDEEIREILQDEECRKLYQTMVEVDSALESPSSIINIDEEWEKFSQKHQLQEVSHPITSWRKLAASIAGFVLISGIAFAAIHTYIKRSQETTQVTADTHPEVIKSDSAKQVAAKDSLTHPEPEKPAILSQSHLGNQKPNPYNGENKSGGTHANHDKGKKKGRAAPWPQRPGRCKSQPSAAAALYPGNHRLYPVQLYTDGSRSHHSVQEL